MWIGSAGFGAMAASDFVAGSGTWGFFAVLAVVWGALAVILFNYEARNKGKEK